MQSEKYSPVEKRPDQLRLVRWASLPHETDVFLSSETDVIGAMATEHHGELIPPAVLLNNDVGDEKHVSLLCSSQNSPRRSEDSRLEHGDFGSIKALASVSSDVENLPTFYAAIRMGPLVTLITVAWGMSVPVWVELLKNRVCLNELHYAANVCAHISDDQYKAEGDAVRSRTANYQQYDILISSVPAVFFSLLVGAWSDRFGRKLPMLFPMIGTLLAAVYISVIGNFPLGPGFNLVSSILSTITGGSSILFMAVFSYVGDHSTKKNRSVNIVILECLISVTTNCGSYLGGFLVEKLGAIVPFYFAAGLHSTAILYVIIFIRDRKRNIVSSEGPSGCAGLFTLQNCKDIVVMLKRVRLGSTRLHLWMVFLSLAVFNAVLAGDGAVTQLFATFAPIRWSLQSYTLWAAITGFVNSFLSMILMLVFRKFFHVADTMIGALACLSATIAYFVYGVAWTGWMLYLGAFMGVFKVLMYVSVRSLMSTMVASDEIGKSMSLISSIQAITPIFGVLIFTNVFAKTSHWFPGLCFIAGAFAIIPVLAVMAYVDVARRRDIYKEKVEDPAVEA